MEKRVKQETESLLGPALRNGLEELAYLVQKAQEQKTAYSFFSNLCNFVIPFIRKSTFLQPLRDEWNNKRNDHAREARKLKKEAIKEITQVVVTLKKHLISSRIKSRQDDLQCIQEMEEILETGGECLGAAYYEMVADKLWSLCRDLAAKDQKKILSGIAEVGYRTEYKDVEKNPQLVKVAHLESVLFKNALGRFLVHQKLAGDWDRIDESWSVWELLHLAEQCWFLPPSYFEEQGLSMGTPKNVQKSNHLFNLRGCWYELQCIRNKCNTDIRPVLFKRDRYEAYLDHIISTIVFCKGLQKKKGNKKSSIPIYSVELKLDGNEIHLLVEEEGGAQSVYLLHSPQENGAPLYFFKELMKNQGNRVKTPEKLTSQPTAKLLTALKITSPFRKLFFGKSETYSGILLRTKEILGKLSLEDQEKIYKKIQGCRLLEGSFSLINHEMIDQ